MIVTNQHAAVSSFIEDMTGVKFAPPFTTIGWLNKHSKIEAGLLFHSWTKNDIEISVGAINLPRPLLLAAYKYVVLQLGCRRATFRTRADNFQAIRALERLGAKEEGRLRCYYPDDVDALVFGILKEDYKYGLNA
jgi:hypothetical protein